MLTKQTTPTQDFPGFKDRTRVSCQLRETTFLNPRFLSVPPRVTTFLFSPFILSFNFTNNNSKSQVPKFGSHTLDHDAPTKNNHAGSPATTATPTTNVENPTPGVGFGVSAITRIWKREDLLKRGSLIARGLALLFSLLSSIIMASNEHGKWKIFDKYEEYRYLLAIAILSTLYTGVQALRHVNESWKGQQIAEQRIYAVVDFLGDQVVAYLLISSASSAIPLTNRMREGQDNIFTDSSASAVSMSFFAFLSLALSAMVSGYKFSTQSYI